MMRVLPEGDRFRFAANATSPSTFGAGARAAISDAEGAGAREDRHDPILREALRGRLPRVPPTRSASAFGGGSIGFVTYERCAAIEGLATRFVGRSGPTVYHAIYDTFAAWDPAASEVEVVSWGLTDEGTFDETLALQRAAGLEERLREADESAAAAEPFAAAPSLRRVRSSLDQDAHASRVVTILDSIGRGDIYQANLTARFDVPFDGDPLSLFEHLLVANPSPHSAYLEADGLVLVSSSPERLLRVRDREAESRPIKGTRPRDVDPARDRAAAEDLLVSPKDRAELLMITDLIRNDLGKVCEYGTVRVPELRGLESFTHVHHLVSTVRGRLRYGVDALDALHALLPCGSITGTPKRRAMQLLAELEPTPRDVYTGSIGWLGFDRNSHWSVAIRTGILANGVFSFGAGGGIVADSVPEREWEELLVKSRAFAEALGLRLETESIGRSS